MPRHLVLVGLSGSGKSTVGPLVAASLDTHFTDIDRVIERATGLPIADLFQEEGEAAFRARERQAVLDGLLLPPHVIAPGGGWAAEPGALDETAGSVTTVYLRVSPDEAARRLNGADDRPLLRGGGVAEGLRRQLALRESAYRRADLGIDATGEPGAVADAVIAAARERAGW
jgi:shikimate kinase